MYTVLACIPTDEIMLSNVGFTTDGRRRGTCFRAVAVRGRKEEKGREGGEKEEVREGDVPFVPAAGRPLS